MAKRRILSILSALIFFGLPVFAQKTISGYVKDASTGEALIGATIREEGGTTGAIADLEGFYTIKVDTKTKAITVSYTGYEPKTVDIGNATTIDVLLSTNKALDEVLVVGYGIINKSDKTGSIETLKPKTEDVMQYNSFQDFMQGRAAGVQVLSNGSELLSPSSIRIRGANSLRGDNEPLYVVDGIIINSSTEDVADPLQGGNSYLSAQSGLSGINAQDIESIEVLKDASATAIYGSRGANGVIIITTKKGRSEKTKFAYRASAKVGQTTRLYDVLDANQFVNYVDEFRTGQGWEPSFYTYGDGSIARYGNSVDFMESKKDSIPRYGQINWYDDILQRSFAQNHRLTASGGNEKNNFYIGAGYTKARGIIPGIELQTTDILMKYSHDLTNWLTISPRISVQSTKNSASKGTENLGSSNTSLMRQIVEGVPLAGYEENNVSVDVQDVVDGPRAWLTDYNDDSKELRGLASLTTDFKLSKVFTYRVLGAVDYRNKKRQLWYGNALFRGSQANGEAGIGTLDRLRYNVDNTLMFNKKYSKKSRINGTVGFIFDETKVQQSGATASNFSNHELRYEGISYGQVFSPFQLERSEERILSFLGRLNYSLNNKYLFTVSFREDGSSKFAKGNKWSFFPSAAFAWKILEEPFMAKSKLWSQATFRIGYGRTGSQAIRPYQTLTRFSPTASLQPTPGGNGVTAVVPENLGNDKLTWETTEQLNLGFDYGFKEDRITGSIEVYHKKTSDLLQLLSIGPSVGFPNLLTNLGDLQNRGLDFSINAYILEKKLKWRAFATFSHNRAKILNLGVPEAQFGTEMRKAILGANVAGGTVFRVPANIFIEGEQPGLFWGYQTDGIVQDDAMLANAPSVQGVAAQLGDVLYVDQNMDGNITEQDLTIIGNPNPKFNLGLGSEFSVKNWSLNFFFNTIQGNDIANGNKGRQAIPTGLPNNNIRSEAYVDAWRPGSTDATAPRLGYDIKGDFTDRMVEDGSFVRLSFVSLGYSLKNNVIKGIEKAHVFISGHNLLLFTQYSGFDPEVNSFSFDPTRQGIDFNAFPNQKSVSMGINIEF